MTAPSDPRAVLEYRVPAAELKVGDLVNTTPGDDDWQQVTGVWTSASSPTTSEQVRKLIATLDGRYVLVELTDLLPVDGGIYFTSELAMVTGDDEGSDQTVAEAVSGEDGERYYLYTKFELVTVRSARS